MTKSKKSSAAARKLCPDVIVSTDTARQPGTDTALTPMLRLIRDRHESGMMAFDKLLAETVHMLGAAERTVEEALDADWLGVYETIPALNDMLPQYADDYDGQEVFKDLSALFYQLQIFTSRLRSGMNQIASLLVRSEEPGGRVPPHLVAALISIEEESHAAG